MYKKVYLKCVLKKILIVRGKSFDNVLFFFNLLIGKRGWKYFVDL